MPNNNRLIIIWKQTRIILNVRSKKHVRLYGERDSQFLADPSERTGLKQERVWTTVGYRGDGVHLLDADVALQQ